VAKTAKVSGLADLLPARQAWIIQDCAIYGNVTITPAMIGL